MRHRGSRAGHAGGSRRLRADALKHGCALSCMEPKRGASQPPRAPRKRCARPRKRCSASCLRDRALLSADACRPASATTMADVHAVLVSRSGRTHLHDTSLRCVRAAQRAPARSVTRYRLLGRHWAPWRRTPASLATVRVPRYPTLFCAGMFRSAPGGSRHANPFDPSLYFYSRRDPPVSPQSRNTRPVMRRGAATGV
jgi:hypothetical protein